MRHVLQDAGVDDEDVAMYIEGALMDEDATLPELAESLQPLIPQIADTVPAKAEAFLRRVREHIMAEEERNHESKAEPCQSESKGGPARPAELPGSTIRQEHPAAAAGNGLTMVETREHDDAENNSASKEAAAERKWPEMDCEAMIEAEEAEEEETALRECATHASARQLREMFPSIQARMIVRVLRRHAGDVDVRVVQRRSYLLEHDMTKEAEEDRKRAVERRQANIAAERERAARRAETQARVLRKYDEVPVEAPRGGKGKRKEKRSARGGGSRKTSRTEIRFLDGKAFKVKAGTKYVYEDTGAKEDPSTFVSLKIKTKGKRGPGFR